MDLFIVTGAAQGLGEAIVQIANERGHHVLAMSRTPIATRERFEVLNLDLQDSEEIASSFSAAFQKIYRRHFDNIHLINNAGVIDPIGPVQDLTIEPLKKNFDEDLLA